MAYVPGSFPVDASPLSQYLMAELQKISDELLSMQEGVILSPRYSVPKKLRDGMLAMADGTSWNPGSGAGLYQYRGGAWRFLG